MKGIILAAGRGSRMGSLTDASPKCLTEIAGKTLLEWQMSAMRYAGIDDMIVVRGYQAASLPGDSYGVVDNRRWNETNMVMSLVAASEHLSAEPCIVSYADIAYHPDAASAVIASEDDIAIAYDVDWAALWQARFQDPLGDAETFRLKDGSLLEIGKTAQSLDEIEGQYMGLLRISPSGWAQITELLAELSDSERDGLDMTSLLSRMLDRNVQIGTIPLKGRWCEMDSGDDLELYRSRLHEADTANVPWQATSRVMCQGERGAYSLCFVFVDEDVEEDAVH